MLRVTGLVKECLIVRLAAGGAYNQSDVFGDRYRHAESARVLTPARLAVYCYILLQVYSDAEPGHSLGVDLEHMPLGKSIVEARQVQEAHRV